jgi:hypothetical protein
MGGVESSGGDIENGDAPGNDPNDPTGEMEGDV